MIKAILWLIVLAFVGTIFYSWGMGGRFGSRSQVVATVDGIEIKVSEFDRSFGNLVNFYRNQFGSQFSEEMIVKLNLKQNALDALIQNKLILLQAEKLNL
ncbi:MAG: hypothetical protein GWO19_27545, partial [Nitrospinaceae bacterium]|nr:hypothetical protein [Nitrospinaceae bacterium]